MPVYNTHTHMLVILLISFDHITTNTLNYIEKIN